MVHKKSSRFLVGRSDLFFRVTVGYEYIRIGVLMVRAVPGHAAVLRPTK